MNQTVLSPLCVYFIVFSLSALKWKVILIIWSLVMLGFLVLYIIIVYMPGGGGWNELLNRSDKGRHFRLLLSLLLLYIIVYYCCC